MNRARRSKLLFAMMLMLGVTIVCTLILYALRQNISLFYTPTQIVHHEAPLNRTIRLGGMVKKGSVKREGRDLDVQFILTDFRHEVVVRYRGILPDLFREGQGIVTTGKIQENGLFSAENVLAKHDENYMPPEVKAAISQKKEAGDTA